MRSKSTVCHLHCAPRIKGMHRAEVERGVRPTGVSDPQRAPPMREDARRAQAMRTPIAFAERHMFNRPVS
jgi:hypothetical protein